MVLNPCLIQIMLLYGNKLNYTITDCRYIIRDADHISHFKIGTKNVIAITHRRDRKTATGVHMQNNKDIQPSSVKRCGLAVPL